MTLISAPPIDIALVHYPVRNRNMEKIGSAVTNLDLHDIARIAKTYGIGTYYVVTPYEDQQKLVKEILHHWLHGHGATVNPKRKEALSIIDMVSDLSELYERAASRRGQRPKVVATSANLVSGALSHAKVRKNVRAGETHLLLFGTAWGLDEEVLKSADGVLEPIHGLYEYNHLPVRAAVAIILDRLLGQGVTT